MDEEVRRLVDTAHDEVGRLLREHRDQLESLAKALLAHETLDAPEAYAAAGLPLRREEAAASEEPSGEPTTVEVGV